VSSPVGPTVGDNVDLVGTVVGDFVVGDREGASVGGGSYVGDVVGLQDVSGV
jgi:hypothetical protein